MIAKSSGPAWNDEEIYYDKKSYFADLTAAIRRAKIFVNLETYIFDYDDIGRQVIAALKAAAAEGVRVRLIIDGFGSLLWSDKILQEFADARVEVRIYHALLFQQAKRLRWLRWDLVLIGIWNLNKRLHRKTCVIDHDLAFVGSFNVTDRPNRETGLKITGSSVKILEDSFEKLWMKKWRSHWRHGHWFYLVRLNDDYRLRRLCNRDLAERIERAEQRIWIASAYFVPPLFVLHALCAAAGSGVDVRVLVPARSDRVFMKWMTITYYRIMLLSGIKIFEYEPCFLHSKTMIIDDWAMIGTSNLNYRSLWHDLEVDIALSHRASRDSLAHQYVADLALSHEVFLPELRRIVVLSWIFESLLQLFRFWV